MRRLIWVFVLSGMLATLMSCNSPKREARRMVALAEALSDTAPDSTARLIDSVLRMPVYFSERQRMEMALLQGEALFRDAPLDDDGFEDSAYRVATSPELERAADYYSRKRQYGKAAHAALYSGYVQQHYNEKEAAMRSFKDAEQYGQLSNDSLTVARAEYRMAKMLYEEYMETEALETFKLADNGLGNHYKERALVQNGMAVCYLVKTNFDSVETCLNQGLSYAERSRSDKMKIKVLNNYSVLYRLQGNYDKALMYLRRMEKEISLDIGDSAFLYLNIGKVFVSEGNMDSADFYFERLDFLLPSVNVNKETKLSVYGVLANYAERRGRISEALKYKDIRENLLSEISNKRQEQTVFRIQQQYDYETMQNAMNQKLMQRHRIIIILGALAILGLVAFALSRIRLAKIRKQEAEAKTSLFHFMQQNKELLERQKVNEKIRTDLLQRQSEKETAFQELANENDTYKKAYQDYAERYSEAKTKELETIIKLAVYVNSKGEKAFLDTLKRTVFNAKTPWDAAIMAFDTLYPNVRENIDLQHSELTEMERKDFILSFIKVSRDEEAAMLDTTIHTVDKLRNSVRKKCGKPKSKGEE